MNQVWKGLLTLVFIFMHSTVYSENSILTFRLVHPDNDKFVKLSPKQVKIDKNQYEFFTKDDENYWVDKKVQLDINDIKTVKIKITTRRLGFKKEEDVEVSQKEIDNSPELRSPTMKGYIAALFFSKEGAAKMERITEKNIRRRLAIIFNNRLLMAPIIQEKISGDEIQIVGLSYDDVTRLRAAIDQRAK